MRPRFIALSHSRRHLHLRFYLNFYCGHLLFSSSSFLQKEERQLTKLKKHLKPEEFAAATAKVTNRKERLETLQTLYEELEEHYDRIIKRLPV